MWQSVCEGGGQNVYGGPKLFYYLPRLLTLSKVCPWILGRGQFLYNFGLLGWPYSEDHEDGDRIFLVGERLQIFRVWQRGTRKKVILPVRDCLVY